ncbi:AraC family transcriptional regulator [Clostridium sp. AL.422]|uniref:helix-turn-helix domain-containing protein n=1 Tax=Clostridium TaxID=1485 RepID=UPI00293DDF58|nr:MULTISPECIES: AraC family transcriptional regulator [unclassified Clostridium]MDV4149261.1 AraC family transcriptional regulator [Clostridium sp. AL.422]
MKKSINWLIEYFSENSIEFVDIFKSGLPPKEKDLNRRTAKNLCGIVIPIQGECSFSLNDDKYNLNKNKILHCGSNMKIRVETEDLGIEYYVVHYKNIAAPEKFKDIEEESFYLEIEDRLLLLKYCESIIDKSLSPDNYSKFSCKVDFINFIDELVKNVRASQYNDKLKLVNRGIEYINKNYNYPISISEISDMLEMDRRRFSEIFQEITGLSPIKYLTEYRLKEAKRLLRFSGYTISEIADMTGYNDCFYFSKTFKKNVGVCPRRYREINSDFTENLIIKR